jgi:hypothetical protein
MMESDDKLREQLKRAWRRGAGDRRPTFESSWQLAQGRYAAARRRYRRFASVAAITAAIVVGLNALTSKDEPTYIEVADLLESTYWSAPSDVLLPHREFDIYQDMPVLFESTKPAGGALL